MYMPRLILVGLSSLALSGLAACPEDDPTTPITDTVQTDTTKTDTVGGGDTPAETTAGCTNDSECVASDPCEAVACIAGECQKTAKPDGATCPVSNATCEDSASCQQGVCVPNLKAAECGAATCGTDACGNSCGTCPSGENCVAGACTGGGPQGCGDLTFEGCCNANGLLQWCENDAAQQQDCAAQGGTCSWSSEQNYFLCTDTPENTPAAFPYFCGGETCETGCDGLECGFECGEICGGCPDGEACGDTNTCEECACGADQVCGTDACGNSCGECGENAGCTADGQCAFDPCAAGVGVVGCCQGNISLWCQDGQPQGAACETTCGWAAEEGYYDCDQTGADPSGTAPLECPEIGDPPTPDEVEAVEVVESSEQAEVVEEPIGDASDAETTEEVIDDTSPDSDDVGPDVEEDTQPETTDDTVEDTTPDVEEDTQPDAAEDATPEVDEDTAAETANDTAVATTHGCAVDGSDATDMTGMASVNLSNIAAWTFGHSLCLKVSAGTAVTWDGDFGAHPLAGGVSPTADGSSPIAGNTPTGGSVSVSFPAAGAFPYFCANHPNMQGLIVVE